MNTQIKYWYDDPSILWKQEQLTEFLPTKEMHIKEKLNSLVRLSIYIGVVLALYYNNIKPISIPLFAMFILTFIVKNSKALENQEKERQEAFANMTQKPTKNNPFMNVLISDYTENPDRPPADYSNPSIQENFEYNLYKDTDDLFNKNNSQRMFYSNPSTTIPNNQTDLANWLYNTGPSCKEKGIFCYKNIHETPMHKRFIFPNPEQNPVNSNKIKIKREDYALKDQITQ